MKLRTISAFVAIALAQQAHATLIDQGLTTLDTTTDLQWLDLTQSSGYTFAQVSSQFASGGLFAGYRYATAAEVQGIFGQFGIPLVVPTQYTGAAAVPVASGIVAFEKLFDVYPTSFFDALVADTVPGDPTSHQLFYGSGTPDGTAPLSASATIYTEFPTDPASYHDNVYANQYTIALGENEVPAGYSNSSFLVRLDVVSAVPEPETYALMGVGLGLLAWRTKRQRTVR